MAVTVTVELEDKVSDAAARAQKEVKVLSGALESVNSRLVKAAALGDIKSFNSLTKQSEALKAALSQLPPAVDTAAQKLAAVSAAKAEKEMRKAATAAEKLEAKKVADVAKASALANKLEAKKLAEAQKASAMAEKIEAKKLADSQKATALAERLEAKKLAEAQKALAMSEKLRAKDLANAQKASAMSEKLRAKDLANAQKASADQKKAEDARRADLAKSIAKEPPVNPGERLKQAADMAILGAATIGKAFTSIGNAAKSLAAGDVEGAISGLTDAFAGLAQTLDLIVPGLGQVASMAIQVGGAFASMAAGVIKNGIEFAISANEEKQAMLGLFDAMGGGVSSGAEIEAMVDGMKAKFGVAKGTLVEYTNQLHQLGMTDLGTLEENLLALSSATALVKDGDKALLEFRKRIEGAASSTGLLKLGGEQLAQLGKTGANVTDVAKNMGLSVQELSSQLTTSGVNAAKFGDALNQAIISKGQGPLARLSSSLGNLKKLFSESIGDLFEDIDVAPFLNEVKKLFSIFSTAKPSGDAMKSGIGGFFKSVLSTLTAVVPKVRNFFLDMVILALEAYLAVRPLVAKVREFFASATGAMILNTVFNTMVTVLKSLGVALVVVLGAAAMVVAIMVSIGAAIWVAITSITQFVALAATTLAGWIASAPQIATDFVMGLVNGITAGATFVVEAVKGLAGSAVDSFKGALGIASPSKVMAQMGGHMSDGLTGGLEEGESEVAGATTGMANAAVAGAAVASAPSGGAAAGGGAPITVNIQIDGAGKSAMEITQEMVASTFARMALQAGV